MIDLSFNPAVIAVALHNVLTPLNLMILFSGVLGGIVIGIIPGLGVVMGVALVLPLTFSMAPEVGISLLIAVYVGGISGSCVTAILIRMPGTPVSVATLLDGFPMAQKGQAGLALSNAVVASFFGTIISGAILVVFAPVMAAFALKFHFAEYVGVCVFALTAVAAITGTTISRGLVSALLGLLIATVGLSKEDGMPRFDFGYSQMLGGIELVPALIGLFGVSQIMHVAVRELKADTGFRARIERTLPTLANIRSNITNYLRSAVIGTVIGVIPAVGGTAAGLISYAQAKSSSRNPEKFGTGHLPGVIAAETANNATIGGTITIMLTLGIPGDTAGAVLIGGMMIHGLVPGPQLFLNNPEIIYGIYFSVFFSSLVMISVLIAFMRPLSRVVDVPSSILLPILLVLAATGTYALNNRVFDVVVMCLMGGLGYIFDRFRYPLAPLVLGLVLGPLIEGNFRKMVGQYGDAMPLFTQPVAATFLALAVVSVVFSLYRRRKSGTVL